MFYVYCVSVEEVLSGNIIRSSYNFINYIIQFRGFEPKSGFLSEKRLNVNGPSTILKVSFYHYFSFCMFLYYLWFQGDTSVVVLFVLCLGVKKILAVGALCMFSYFS